MGGIEALGCDVGACRGAAQVQAAVAHALAMHALGLQLHTVGAVLTVLGGRVVFER